MDAQLKKVAGTPAKFKDGVISVNESATLTVEVPLDSLEQRDAVKSLFDVMDTEYIKLNVKVQQMKFDVSTGKTSQESEEKTA